MIIILLFIIFNVFYIQIKESANVIHRVVNCNRWPHLRPELDLISLQIYHSDAQIQFANLEFSWKLVAMVRAAFLPLEHLTYFLLPLADSKFLYYISLGSHPV